MDYYEQREDRDGIRFSWNIWPSSSIEAKRLVVPIGCIYAPLKRRSNLRTVYYQPLECPFCHTYLNPYCTIEFNFKSWTCVFCHQKVNFPPNYHSMTVDNLSAELLQDATTIEYAFTKKSVDGENSFVRMSPVFLFVLDVALDDEQLTAETDSIIHIITQLPPDTIVGLMTFGSVVSVYDLTCSDYIKRYIFRGDINISPAKLSRVLRIEGGNSIFLPLSQCKINFLTIIESLKPDPAPIGPKRRALRTSGAAVSIAVSLMGNIYTGTGGRIMIFMGGPCTSGVGMIVSDSLKEEIRSHTEIMNESAKHVKKSVEFYEEISKRAANQGHAIDLFSCSLDQIGLYEMKSLSHETSGFIIFADGFDTPVYQNSLQRIFEREDPEDYNSPLLMGLNATIRVLTAPGITVAGAIGHLVSLGEKAINVSDDPIGIGGTQTWKLCSLDPNCNIAFFFQIVNPHNQQIPIDRKAVVQFCTTYQHPLGHQVLRVTTCAHCWAPAGSNLAPGFDQMTATTLMARLAVFKSEYEDDNPVRWLDKNLIMLLNHFCEFRKGDPESLRIPNEMNIIYQFFFYLRRGHLIQVFNNTPDETVFFRFYLQRENVPNCLVMIQPTLDSYSLENCSPTPVMLSATSITPSDVLLLDTFFLVIVHYGSIVAEWRQAQYHLNPEYGNFKELLEVPVQEAAELMHSRMPYPNYVECDQGTSQARYLAATVDPAITQSTMMNKTQDQGQVIFTDDVSLKNFYEHLKKRVVEYEN